jgi:hypothetical protein
LTEVVEEQKRQVPYRLLAAISGHVMSSMHEHPRWDVIDHLQGALEKHWPPTPRVRKLEWRSYPEDGTRSFEGQNAQRRYVSRALLPWKKAVFVMEKDGLFSLEDDARLVFLTEQDARDHAQAEFEQAALASFEDDVTKAATGESKDSTG